MKVSIVVVAEGTRTLSRAVESALTQEQVDVEVLVVARKGLDEMGGLADPRVELIECGKTQGRGGAANAGLARASGEWSMVLEAKDRIAPDHARSLLTAVGRSNGQRVAYGGVHLHTGGKVHTVSPAYWRQRLFRQPLVPSCGVLFDTGLVSRNGCRFDNQFTLFEHWDFMLQCAELTDFVHCESVTATREENTKPRSTSVKANADRLQKKWLERYNEVCGIANATAQQVSTAIREGSTEEIGPLLTSALQHDPGNPLLLNQLAWHLQHSRDIKGALSAIRRACDSDPGAMKLLGDRVLLEHLVGNVEQSRKCFVRLVERSATSDEMLRMRSIGVFIGAEIERV